MDVTTHENASAMITGYFLLGIYRFDNVISNKVLVAPVLDFAAIMREWHSFDKLQD